MIRILEISWLVLGIIALSAGLFKVFSDEASEAVFYGVIMALSLVMFILRRKQRMRIEKES